VVKKSFGYVFTDAKVHECDEQTDGQTGKHIVVLQ